MQWRGANDRLIRPPETTLVGIDFRDKIIRLQITFYFDSVVELITLNAHRHMCNKLINLAYALLVLSFAVLSFTSSSFQACSGLNCCAIATEIVAEKKVSVE